MRVFGVALGETMANNEDINFRIANKIINSAYHEECKVNMELYGYEKNNESHW